MTRSTQSPATSQEGFTLLEALVTIVIVSIGLLGILGLQTVSIANTQSSAARSQATIAADNIADRMRANFTGARASAYDAVGHPAAGAEPKTCTVAAACTPLEMAARDAWEWDNTLGPPHLPAGEGHIDCNGTRDGECVSYLVTVLWSARDANRKAGPADPDKDQCTNSDPLLGGCFQTVVRP